jgi:hypothetical protein
MTTVYLVGAGVNRQIRDFHGLCPPLIGELFQVASQMPGLQDRGERLTQVFDYINRYWKKTQDDLAKTSFDLEECFTLLDLQLVDALSIGNQPLVAELQTVNFRLKSLLASVLTEFELHALTSDVMRAFGDRLYAEKPVILSFNYDLCLEAVIELASRPNINIPNAFHRDPRDGSPIPDELLTYSHYTWNRTLAYAQHFDKVQLQQAGVSQYVDGARFYSVPGNTLYDWYILKLHGSLNWFRYLPIRRLPASIEGVVPFTQELAGQALLVRGHWWLGDPPDLDGWYLDPIILTPVLHKDRYLSEPLYRRVVAQLWRKAKEALRTCDKLVIIGYSFPKTDFHTRKLFLEAFADHVLKELVVVNPDSNAIELAAALCHVANPAAFEQLSEYLAA